MSIGFDEAPARCRRQNTLLSLSSRAIAMELRGVVDDLGTILLAGMCIAGIVIVASTFDGDLQGSDEVIAAILGTVSLFAVLAALELADRLKRKRCRKSAEKTGR